MIAQSDETEGPYFGERKLDKAYEIQAQVMQKRSRPPAGNFHRCLVVRDPPLISKRSSWSLPGSSDDEESFCLGEKSFHMWQPLDNSSRAMLCAIWLLEMTDTRLLEQSFYFIYLVIGLV